MTERVERMREQATEAVQRGQDAAAQARDTAAQKVGEAREAAVSAVGDAREAATQKVGDARDAAAQKVGDAREAAVQVAQDAAAQAADLAAAVVARVKPRLRGVIHEYAFWTAILLGAILVASANGGRAQLATSIYALGICGLFGVSALYHRHTWQPRARRWMRRLDHSMIFVFIAASFTPIALLALHGALATTVFATVWGGALGGVVLTLLWTDAPKWLSASVYVALGMVALVTIPSLWDSLGWLPVAGLAFGGALYTAGAVIYATERPDPAPETFGYHEIFHTLVTGAAGAHYAVIAFAVLPLAH